MSFSEGPSLFKVFTFQLRRKNPVEKNAKYMASCITILLINIPYFISVTSIILVWWILPNQISFHEIIFAWIPIVTSGLNPLIILSRKSDARKAILDLINNSWAARKYGVDNTHSITQSSQLPCSRAPPSPNLSRAPPSPNLSRDPPTPNLSRAPPTPNPARIKDRQPTVLANKNAGAPDV